MIKEEIRKGNGLDYTNGGQEKVKRGSVGAGRKGVPLA
jgi:hypothetical protein